MIYHISKNLRVEWSEIIQAGESGKLARNSRLSSSLLFRSLFYFCSFFFFRPSYWVKCPWVALLSWFGPSPLLLFPVLDLFLLCFFTETWWAPRAVDKRCSDFGGAGLGRWWPIECWMGDCQVWWLWRLIWCTRLGALVVSTNAVGLHPLWIVGRSVVERGEGLSVDVARFFWLGATSMTGGFSCITLLIFS